MIYSHFNHIIEYCSNNSSSFWGAFWGAFFAFLFGLITYWVTKRLERFNKHINSLVKLENLINRHLDEIAAAEFQSKNIAELLKEHKLTFYRFPPFKLIENLEFEFGSLDIANRYLGYSTYISRLNGDMSSANHAFTRFEDVLINKIKLEKENVDFMIDTMNKFGKFFMGLTEEGKNLLVITRLNFKKIKDKNKFFYGVLNNDWEIILTKTEIEQELKKLNDEIELIRKNSAEKIKNF